MKVIISAFLLTLGIGFIQAQEAVVSPDAPDGAEAVGETTTETPNADATPEEAEAVIPTAFDITRYQSSWDKNPFNLKTVAVVQTQVAWSQDWALAGMFNHKGKIRISIKNKQTNEFKHINSDGKADAEFRFVSANFNRNRNEASAKIAKGSEEAELKYDDTTGAAPVTINNTMRPQGGPGQPPGGVPVPGMPGQQINGGVPRPGQPAYSKPGVATPNGRVFNAPGLPGGVSSQPGVQGINANNNVNGVPQNNGLQLNGLPQNGNGNGNSNVGNIGQPGAQPPVISRRRQLIPAPVIPPQP